MMSYFWGASGQQVVGGAV